jgi:hypothetical protein
VQEFVLPACRSLEKMSYQNWRSFTHMACGLLALFCRSLTRGISPSIGRLPSRPMPRARTKFRLLVVLDRLLVGWV